jgi:outer membrane lipoprotein-sorting protein
VRLRYLALTLFTTLCGAAASPDAILAKMDSSAVAFRAMSADIRKTLHTHVINSDDTEEGRVLVRRSGKGLRMLTELVKPDSKSATFDGGKIELFYPKLNKVEEYNVGKSRGMVEQFFLLGFGMPRKDLERDYTVTIGGEEVVEGHKTVRLELTPKAEDLSRHIKKAELWIDPATGYPVQQKFHQSGGDYHVVTYLNLKINPALSDGDLKLKLPKGVQREKK